MNIKEGGDTQSLREVTMTLEDLQRASTVTHTGTISAGGARKPAPEPTQQPQAALQQAPRRPLIQSPEPQAKVASELDSRFIDISGQLPSQMAFYTTFDSLAIRPFSLVEVQKMHRAISEGSFRMQVEAISACLSQSAMDLTWGDFQYVQYWLRINSYKKHPVTIPFTCTNPDHLEWTVNGKPNPEDPEAPIPCPEETLNNSYTITKDDLVPVLVDVDTLNAFLKTFHEEYGLYLWAPMMRDIVEMENDLKALQMKQNVASMHGGKNKNVPQVAQVAQQLPFDVSKDYIDRYAALLNPRHHGNTLRERREFYQQLSNTASPDLGADMMQWESLSEHGVRQYISPTCKECGHVIGHLPYRIDPLAFLPE